MASAVRAYLLIETQAGESSSVLENLKLLEQTTQVDLVTGPYDIICVIETDNLDDLGALIRDRIHPMPGVSRTMSCMHIGM